MIIDQHNLYFTEGKGNGVFLVRESNSSDGDYVLSVLHNVGSASN